MFQFFCSGIVSIAILEMHLDTLHLNILNDNVYLHKAISQKKYNVATLFIYYPSSNCIVLANNQAQVTSSFILGLRIQSALRTTTLESTSVLLNRVTSINTD